MSTPKKTGKAAVKPAKKVPAKSGGKPRKRTSAKTRIVNRMIKDFKKKLDEGEVKVSVGDFIRLVQIQDEMQADAPKEITVTWVEPAERESSSET